MNLQVKMAPETRVREILGALGLDGEPTCPKTLGGSLLHALGLVADAPVWRVAIIPQDEYMRAVDEWTIPAPGSDKAPPPKAGPRASAVLLGEVARSIMENESCEASAKGVGSAGYRVLLSLPKPSVPEAPPNGEERRSTSPSSGSASPRRGRPLRSRSQRSRGSSSRSRSTQTHKPAGSALPPSPPSPRQQGDKSCAA